MRWGDGVLAGCVAVVLLAGCQKPEKLTQQDVAIANETTAEVYAENAAVVSSPHRNYRWLTPEEMVQYRLGYDPTMSSSTRYEVEQAIDDDLAQKGYRQAQPADFLVAFSDAYIDRNRSDPGPLGVEGFGISVGSAEGVTESQTEAYDDMESYRKPEETFRIVFLDAKTRRLLWRGTGKEVLGNEQSAGKIEGAVFRALDDMPEPLIR
ncbi:MAG: DUF4136 domain-containing protein [Rhodospirillales bacterium]